MARFLDPPPPKPLLPEEKIPKVYKSMRFKVFLGAFLGYSAYYLVRKNLSLAAPGMITEAEARRELMEEAMKRRDEEAILAIPLEDNAAIHERWDKYMTRKRREAMALRAGPPPEVRKALREKRKKRK